MNEIKWIKIETDIFDDEKIALIESMPNGDSIIVVWFKLLCLAGKQNNNGVFMLNDRMPYTDEMLSAIFRRPLTTVRLALKTFQEFGMIDIVENTVTIPHWEEHQNTEALARKREQTRKRVAEMRKRQKAALAGKPDSQTSAALPPSDPVSEQSESVSEQSEDVTRYTRVTNAPVTHLEKEEERDIRSIDSMSLDNSNNLLVSNTIDSISSINDSREHNISSNKAKRQTSNTSCDGRPTGVMTTGIPSIEDVENFFVEDGIQHVDPQKFVSYNDNRNWMINGKPIDDWRGLARNWESRDRAKAPTPQPQPRKASSPEDVMRKYHVTYDEAVQMIRGMLC